MAQGSTGAQCRGGSRPPRSATRRAILFARSSWLVLPGPLLAAEGPVSQRERRALPPGGSIKAAQAVAGAAPCRDPAQQQAIAEGAAGLKNQPVDEARAQRPADFLFPLTDVFAAVPAGAEGGGQASGTDGVADAEAPEGVLDPRGFPGEEEMAVRDR